jgi:hypothetical protein
MQVAKPPGGFIVQEPAPVAALITSKAKSWPRLPEFWTDIKARLKQTGHREGDPVGRRGRLFIAEGDAASGLPTVKIVYEVLGDTLYIRMVLVD